ncbi:MAG: alanine racemase [Kiritimatiellia bacterium]
MMRSVPVYVPCSIYSSTTGWMIKSHSDGHHGLSGALHAARDATTLPDARMRVELDLDVLASNVRAVKSAATPGAEMIFVVKADAYGHGHAGVVPAAHEARAAWFAVVSLREALAVRALCPAAGVLMLGVADPEDAAVIAQHRITPVVVGADHAADLSAAAREAGVEIACHWKVDTGMGRLGSLPQGAADEEAVLLNRLPGLRMTGLMSHFAASGRPHRPELAGADRAVPAGGAGRRSRHEATLMKHTCPAAARFPVSVRTGLRLQCPGILLYGYGCREPGMRCADAPGCNGRGRLVQVEAGADGCAVGCCSPPFRTWRT